MLLREFYQYCHTEWGTVCQVSAWKSTIGPSCRPSSLCSMWTCNGTEEEAWQRQILAHAQMSPRLSNYTIATSGKCLLPLYWPQWLPQFTTSIMWNHWISLYVYDWHASTSGCWTHWKVVGYSGWLVQHVLRGLHYYHARMTTNAWYTYVTNTDWWSTFCRVLKVQQRIHTTRWSSTSITRCRCHSWKSMQSQQPCQWPLGVWPKAKHWCPILPCGQMWLKYTVANYPVRMCAWVCHPLWQMACIYDFEYFWFWSLHREPSASVCESSNWSNTQAIECSWLNSKIRILKKMCGVPATTFQLYLDYFCWCATQEGDIFLEFLCDIRAVYA